MIHTTQFTTSSLSPTVAMAHGSSWCVAAAVAGLLVLGGCASPQPPSAELQAAELAITSAEQARVADYASPELGQARDKLAAARVAVQEKKMVEARRLAEQSQLDAQLATARAEATKAKLVNDEMLKSTESMKQEMQRTTDSLGTTGASQ